MRRLRHLALLLALPGLGPAPEALASQAGWLALSSFLLPGSGQAVNGQPLKAAGHLGTAIAGYQTTQLYTARDDYIDSEDRYDQDNQRITTNRTSERAEIASSLTVATMAYSSYDAYRTRRLQLANRGYRTPAPPDQLGELARAPFQPSHLMRWTTVLPVALSASSLLVGPEDSWVTEIKGGLTRGEAAAYAFAQHGGVALGEEALYRGVLNNSLSHQLGELWGLGASSLAFGVSHTGGGLSADIRSATAMGAYLGWVHQRNDYLAALHHEPEDRTAQASLQIPF